MSDHSDDEQHSEGEEEEELSSQEEEPQSDDEQENGHEEVEGEGENLMDGLPASVVRRVNELKELDQKRQAFMAEYLNERAALEVKYGVMCETLYRQRAQIVGGETDTDAAAQKEDEIPTKGIPQFWVIAMGHEATIASLFEADDIDCLEYLEDITCTDDTDGKGFCLKFFFKPNPYFENSCLTKKYEVPNLFLGDEPVLKNVKGCVIQWKPNQCLTYKSVQKKQRGKGKNKGQLRTVTKQERQESFFHWFEPPQMPNLQDMNEAEAEKLEELFEQDFDVAQSFRQQIIPKAVQWFTGDVAQQDLDSAVNALIEGNQK